MNEIYLVAVSGGPDSMALLDLLRRMDKRLVVCHVNYQKRSSAKRDEKIVRDYCDKYKIVFKVSYPKQIDKGNFQSWARDVRYQFFKEVANEFNTDKLFVAHHLDDYIETFIMQKIKGADYDYYGIDSLIDYEGLKIYRPLLYYSKNMLIEYCDKNYINYGIDETNLSDDYTRNRIRHQIVDNLSITDKRKIFKRLEKLNLKRKAYLNNLKNLYRREVYSFEEYLNIDDKDSFLRLKLFKNISNDYLKEIKRQIIEANSLYMQVGERIISKEYGNIYFADSFRPYSYTYFKFQLDKKEYYELVDNADSFHRATLSEDDYPITIRNYQKGDYIDMRYGRKKLSRYFIDHKIPKIYRVSYPVVVNRHGEIVFVPNIGSDKTHYSTKANFFMIEYLNIWRMDK